LQQTSVFGVHCRAFHFSVEALSPLFPTRCFVHSTSRYGPQLLIWLPATTRTSFFSFSLSSTNYSRATFIPILFAVLFWADSFRLGPPSSLRYNQRVLHPLRRCSQSTFPFLFFVLFLTLCLGTRSM
jgi:hypothetical protein